MLLKPIRNRPRVEERLFLLAFCLVCPACAQPTGIHAAATAGDTARVKAFLDQDRQLVNAADRAGWTPLHFAAAQGNQAVAELLLARGADVNARVKDGGGTPLHVAASNGHKAIVAILLAKGAGANLTDDHQWTPLHRAALRGDQAVAELLVAKGANVNAWSDTGITPIDQAIQSGHKDFAGFLREHTHTSLPIADDFSGNCQWPSGESEVFAFNCEGGAYRMHLKKPGPVHVLQNFALGVPALSAEVDANVASGRGTERGAATFGIGCLADRERGYVVLLKNDGAWAIMRLEKGFTSLAGTNQPGAVRWLGPKPRLSIVCAVEAGKRTSLVSLSVNGQKVGSVEDRRYYGPLNGVALYTDTFPGTVIFKRFVAREP